MHFGLLLQLLVLASSQANTLAKSKQPPEADTRHDSTFSSLRNLKRNPDHTKKRSVWPDEYHLTHLKRLSLINSNASVYLNVSSHMVTLNETSRNVTTNSTSSKAASAAGLETVFGQPVTSSAGTKSTSVQGSVSNATYDTLLRYVKFSSAAYAPQCASPGGVVLVGGFGAAYTGSASANLGYIARDDDEKELIVVYQGDPTLGSLPSARTSVQGSSLVTALSGFGAPTGAMVNVDLQQILANVSASLFSVLSNQLQAHSGYGITFTGHGTGGSLASMTAVSIVAAFNTTNVPPMQVITFGAPRIGNQIWANHTESLFLNGQTARHLRVTHSIDNIPQVLTPSNGYQHSAVEMFQSTDQIGSQSLVQCTGAEDMTCNDSILGTATFVSQASSAQSDHDAVTTSTTSADTDNIASTAASGETTSSGNQALSASDQSLSTQAAVACSQCAGTDCIGCIDDSGSTVQGLQATSSGSDESSASAAPQAVQQPTYEIDPTTGLIVPLTGSSASIAPQAAQTPTYQIDPTTGLIVPVSGTSATLSDSLDPATGLPYGTAVDPTTGITSQSSATTNAIDPFTGVQYSAESAEVAALDAQYDPAVTNVVGANNAGLLSFISQDRVNSTTSQVNKAIVDKTVVKRQQTSTTVTNAAGQKYLGIDMISDALQFCSAVSPRTSETSSDAAAASTPSAVGSVTAASSTGDSVLSAGVTNVNGITLSSAANTIGNGSVVSSSAIDKKDVELQVLVAVLSLFSILMY